MAEAPSVELLTEQELCAAIGINRYYLRRVRRWLFIEPFRAFPGRGSESRYPPIAVPMIQRFRELQQETRKIDECIWGVWLDDFPLEIGKWADARLAQFEVSLSTTEHQELLKTIDAISKATPNRTSPRRPISSRLRRWEEVSLYVWAIAVAAGLTPAKSLYDPSSPPFEALKRAAGLSGNWGPPDPELLVESFSVRRMRDVLRDATRDELEQARHDWKILSELAAKSSEIDWRAVRKVLNVQRTTLAQPLAPLDIFVALWRDLDARAAFLSYLIFIRRSPDHSHRLSEILALARCIHHVFPRRTYGNRTEHAAFPIQEAGPLAASVEMPVPTHEL